MSARASPPSSTLRLLYVTPYGFDDRLRHFPEFVLARRLAREGWPVSACTLADSPVAGREVVDGIDVRRLRGRADRLRGLVAAMRDRPDVVHLFHLRNPLAVPALLLARMLGRPTVFSEYGLLHDPWLVGDRDDPLAGDLSTDTVILRAREILTRRGHGLVGNLRSYAYHLAMAKASRVVFLSRHNLEVAGRLGIDHASWLPGVIDGERWKEVQPGLLSGADDVSVANGPYALWVGQLKLRKGWDLLLRAIPAIPRDVCPRFVFVSPTFAAEPPHFTALAAELGVADRVTYLPRVSNRALRGLYAGARAVVVPSRYEGFGLPVLEGFQAGVPVVAADVVALSEVVRHGENGYLFARDDAAGLARGLCALLTDAELAARLVEGGRRTLAEHDVERHLGAWIDLYRSAAGR